MNRINLSCLLVFTLLFGSCANDNTNQDDNEVDVPKGSVLFSSADAPQTRTSAKYVGDGLDFYWTRNDKIWVRDDNGVLRQDNSNDIQKQLDASGQDVTPKASFIVSGSFTKTTHKVRYTGQQNYKNQITINNKQTQKIPNKADHIAGDGDFGVATATKSGNRYNFTLEHKAAYITFTPYTAQNVLTSAKVEKIRLFTDNNNDALAGTFTLADDGTLSSPYSKSNSIELITKNEYGSVNRYGYPIPSAPSYSTNAATMVINPGTYSNVYVEYSIYDPATNVRGVIIKSYHNVTFTAGKNKKFETNLQVKEYSADGYYMWDAAEPCWKGYEWDNPNPALRLQPTFYSATPPTYGYPQNNTDSRWYNETPNYQDPTGVAPAVHASHSAANCFNVNEMSWLVREATWGHYYYDDKILWALMGHLYVGGVWLPKPNKIPGFSKIKDSQWGKDMTKSKYQGVYYDNNNTGAPVGRPSNLNDYFYLPLLGRYGTNGQLTEVGAGVYLWTSTPGAGWNSNYSYIVWFSRSYVGINAGHYRNQSLRILNSSNLDEYSPF